MGAVLTWTAAFFLLGLPIFHLWLQVPIKKIAAFTALACVLQLLVTPWLFEVRATIQSPTGLRSKRRIVVIVWLSLLSLLFNYFLLRDAAPDSGARAVFLVSPIVVGMVALIILGIISRRRRAD
jgi:hypothetical protein